MLKFIPGIILVQTGTGVLIFFGLQIEAYNYQAMAITAILTILMIILAGFWFSSIARNQYQSSLETTREEHARERETIRVNAERQKSRVVSRSQKEVMKEVKRTNAAASFKIGVTFAGALTFGVIMLYTQFITAGLLVLTTVGGGLAGYLFKGRRDRMKKQKLIGMNLRVSKKERISQLN